MIKKAIANITTRSKTLKVLPEVFKMVMNIQLEGTIWQRFIYRIKVMFSAMHLFRLYKTERDCNVNIFRYTEILDDMGVMIQVVRPSDGDEYDVPCLECGACDAQHEIGKDMFQQENPYSHEN